MPTVTVIPAKEKVRTTINETLVSHLKVAAYARVSTDQEEQLTSYEAQVAYYTDYIKKNPNWQFVEVFADEGITGTNTKKRDGFNRMIDLAMHGGIDLILTKSISRFARNTVDTLQYVRKLKSAGVEVVFEKENLHTFDPKCEIMLTIMSSLAQEESRSISENVRWSKQKSMQNGKITLNYSHFIGYRKGKDGRPEIVEKEAKIIRQIYQMFLSGKGLREIARILTSDGIPTPQGKRNWHSSTVKSILSNEKYKGDALLQKYYVADYLTKERKKNHGEKKQYYIKGSHPAIIDENTFDKVQDLLEKNKKPINRKKNTNYNSPCADSSDRVVFSNHIFCGECGSPYCPHQRDYKGHPTIYWYCKNKYKKSHCPTPIVKEGELKRLIVPILEEQGYKYAKFTTERWQNNISKVIIRKENTATVTLKDDTVRHIPLK